METVGGMVVVLGALGGVFGIAEYAFARQVSPHVTRKIVHIGAGVVTAGMPFVLSLRGMVGIGVAASLFMVWTKRKRVLQSVHALSIDEVGAMVYSPVVTVLALLMVPQYTVIYQGAVLVLALADAAAGLVGRVYGAHRPPVMRGKSLEGSAACFVVTAPLLFGVSVFMGVSGSVLLMGHCLLGAMFVTLTEACSWGGWDNATVPLAAALVLFVLV